MYRQIWIHPDDRQFQRIVFRTTPDSQILDYTLNTVTFGVNCAPYLAIRTLHKLAEDCADNHPTVSHIIRNDMYVDDVLTGSHLMHEAKSSQRT